MESLAHDAEKYASKNMGELYDHPSLTHQMMNCFLENIVRFLYLLP
jgi:hypothetical protein